MKTSILLLATLLTAPAFAVQFPFPAQSVEGNIYPCTSQGKDYFCMVLGLDLYVSDRHPPENNEPLSQPINPIITSSVMLGADDRIYIDFDNPVYTHSKQ